MPSSAIKEHLTKMAVLDACTAAGVPHGSALAEQLHKEAVMSSSPGSTYVQTVSGQSLEARISELRREARFVADLPAEAPNIHISDETSIRANFERIARGEAKVVD
jgi:hypothetical protein